MEKLPLYKMFIADDFEGEEEVDFVALVESPAIQRNFLAFAEGVAHYTADGKLYEGPMHKDASGRLMTGAVHTADSEYLYHFEELAEVGPRGGIKESPKAPKSDTKNPNPTGEGTAGGDASGKRGAKVTAEQEKTLQNKVDDFNERDSNTKNGRATLGALKSVFQRGLGAYNVSHSPEVKSSEQWAYARVNAFLYLLKNGRPENPKYDTDFDLLPKGHPKEKMAEIQVIVCKECGHSWDYQEGGKDPYTCHLCGADNTPKAAAFESYSDYPDGVKGNAKKVIEYTEANGWGSCGTPVGKQRANQLANGEPISLDTIQRMYSYLSRHEVDLESSTAYGDGCGKLMYDAWGGKAALGWSRNKLRELGKLEAEFSTKLTFAVQDEDQRIVSGPLMIADLPIYRKDEEGEYYVMFTGEQIKKIVQRFFKKGYQAKVNIEHGKQAEGVYMFESYIIDKDRGVNPPKGFEDVANGSWFGSFKVENEKLWNEVKAGTFKGFSVEGLFRYEKAGMIMQKEEQIMAQIFKILEQIEQK
jgi:hypothetical protein